jgi:hypothetical protein
MKEKNRAREGFRGERMSGAIQEIGPFVIQDHSGRGTEG